MIASDITGQFFFSVGRTWVRTRLFIIVIIVVVIVIIIIVVVIIFIFLLLSSMKYRGLFKALQAKGVLEIKLRRDDIRVL